MGLNLTVSEKITAKKAVLVPKSAGNGNLFIS